jgi:hypothetical protein
MALERAPMSDHGLPPVPPNDGPSHTHPGRLEISAGLNAHDEWRVIVTLSTNIDVPAGHRVSADFSVDQTDVLVKALLQAQGDIRTGRIR